jgi:hypothetical protein
MQTVSLEDLFRDLDGQEFETRRALEEAVVEVFNRHISAFPVGFTYEDALEGARTHGWLDVSGFERHGVRVRLPEAAPAAHASS